MAPSSVVEGNGVGGAKIADSADCTARRPKVRPSRKGRNVRPRSAKTRITVNLNLADGVGGNRHRGCSKRRGANQQRASTKCKGEKVASSWSAPELSVAADNIRTLDTLDSEDEHRRPFERRQSSTVGVNSRLHETETSRCRQLEQRCAEVEAKCSSISDELTFYKAEVRARITAVGKAEIILHDVCQAMATRLGRADGTNILLNKGKILSEVHESPAGFAAQVKKNVSLQMTKWETDRAALEALAERAGAEATLAAKAHETERAELLAQTHRLKGIIEEAKADREELLEEAKTTAEKSRQEILTATSENEKLCTEKHDLVAKNNALCQGFADKEKQFHIQLDRFMEYHRAAKNVSKKLGKCQEAARRQQNLITSERKEFRRQLQTFQKWQNENVDLRHEVKLLAAQQMTLRRKLTLAESGLAGSAGTRRAVLGGTVDRLQRAETSARHQAYKYRELAGSREIRVAQLEAQISSLKATVKNLHRIMQEAPAKDLYETEIARFARTTPKVLAKQNTSGLSKDDMLTSMAQLKLLREKEEQKDTLIELARDRNELELCVRDLKARNSWLETQVLLGSADSCRVAAAQGNEGTTSPSRGSVGGACAEQNTAPYDGALATAAGANDAYSRLERRLEAKERAARGDVDDGVPQLMASVRRKIQFLEECDRSSVKERQQSSSAANCPNRRRGGRGLGVAAVRATRARQRPQSAKSSCRPPLYQGLGIGSFRRSGAIVRARVSQDDSGLIKHLRVVPSNDIDI